MKKHFVLFADREVLSLRVIAMNQKNSEQKPKKQKKTKRKCTLKSYKVIFSLSPSFSLLRKMNTIILPCIDSNVNVEACLFLSLF